MIFNKLIDGDSANAIVFYPCWGCSAKLLRKLYSKMFKKQTCIFYDYPYSILNSNPAETKQNILDVVRDSIEILGEYKSVNLFGASLGSFIALKVASLEPKTKKIMLITAGENLAETVWLGYATKKLRKAMEEDGMSLSKLKEEWQELEPDFSQIKRKMIFLLQSKKDHTILQDNRMRLLEKLANDNLIVERHCSFNHTLTVFIGMLRFRMIYKFLRD